MVPGYYFEPIPVVTLRTGPVIGDDAAGYGMRGKVAAVPVRQPLAHEGIWRVTLEGEAFGRIIRCPVHPEPTLWWRLLRMDDMTDAQLDIYEAAMSEPPQVPGGSGHE